MILKFQKNIICENASSFSCTFICQDLKNLLYKIREAIFQDEGAKLETSTDVYHPHILMDIQSHMDSQNFVRWFVEILIVKVHESIFRSPISKIIIRKIIVKLVMWDFFKWNTRYSRFSSNEIRVSIFQNEGAKLETSNVYHPHILDDIQHLMDFLIISMNIFKYSEYHVKSSKFFDFLRLEIN